MINQDGRVIVHYEILLEGFLKLRLDDLYDKILYKAREIFAIDFLWN